MAKVLKEVDGETRTLDQLRADVFCDLVLEGETRSHPRAARGIRGTVVTTVPALALLEANDAARGCGGTGPSACRGWRADPPDQGDGARLRGGRMDTAPPPSPDRERTLVRP